MAIESIHIGNNYPGTGNDLTWCVKDSTDFTSQFQDWRFDTKTPNEVKEPSVFLEYFYNLVHRFRTGLNKGFGFTFSGHGTRKYTSTGEDDFYNEAEWLENGIVLDDEIGEIVNLIPDGCPNFIFFDSCHSQGAMRLYGGNANNKIKYVPPDFIIPGARKKVREIVGNEIYFAACGSAEYSYDAGDLKNGAGTHYLLKSMSKDTSFYTWYENLRMYLPSSDYPQTPYLEAKEENKSKVFYQWLNPVSTGIEDIPITEIPVIIVTLTLWQRVWKWIKKLFGYQ